MRKRDFLWLLAYPLYQIVGTLRHEGAHALAALMAGGHITEFVFWPTFREGSGMYWGYVQWQGAHSWSTLAAPYFADLVTFGIFFALCMGLRFKHRWLWLNAVILGMLSPLINSAYNYFNHSPNGDVVRLLAALPNWPVHAYFAVTLLLYAVGIYATLKYAPTQDP